MQEGKLLLPLLGGLALLLSGCETAPKKAPEPAAEPLPREVEVSLDQRWRATAEDPRSIADLLSRLQGVELRRQARRGALGPADIRQALNRLDVARSHTRKARTILSGLYGYRKAGGVSFSTSWERDLWKRLATHRRQGDRPAADVTDFDLLAARRSLVGQVTKAWFYLKGIRELRQRALEARDLHQQVLERRQTSHRLERENGDEILATRKELARADARAKQLKRAERLAHQALVALVADPGGSVTAESSVRPIPGGLPLSLLRQRPDLRRASGGLVSTGVVEDPERIHPPAVAVTAKGGRTTRDSGKWSRLKPEQLAGKLGLSAQGGEQQAAVLVWADALLAALKEVRAVLNEGRKLMAQQTGLEAEEQRARRSVNRLRARYSARRADLLDILHGQIRLAEISGKLAYVRSRVQGQRLDGYLALGGAGFRK